VTEVVLLYVPSNLIKIHSVVSELLQCADRRQLTRQFLQLCCEDAKKITHKQAYFHEWNDLESFININNVTCISD
jgi:hypothetical protein